jgi:alkyl hydroperoxide reductase subunit F
MEIKIYSTPTCGYCKLLKQYLDEKGVKYEAIDVFENKEAADEMVKKSGQQGVPVTIANKDGKEQIIIGFDKTKIDELIS